jgi:hypothetical protein
MAQQEEFYAARAAEARAEASTAKLDNVRERALRSAEAWEAMASRAAGVTLARETRDAEKAATNLRDYETADADEDLSL